jgi:hypothetical protein
MLAIIHCLIKADPTKGSTGMTIGTQYLKGGAGIPVHRHEQDKILFVQEDPPSWANRASLVISCRARATGHCPIALTYFRPVQILESVF